jgi:hypothetical protein
MVKNKKAQLKIQQMAFMLIAVTLFFVLIGLFITGIVFSGLKKSSEVLEEENAMLLVSELSNSPEFSCGEAFRYGKTNCVDSDKIMILRNMNEYADFWDVAAIEIRKIYPAYERETECSEENYPDCNVMEIYSKSVKKGAYNSNFVSLCRKEKNAETGEIYDKCELAKLLVSYEQK